MKTQKITEWCGRAGAALVAVGALSLPLVGLAATPMISSITAAPTSSGATIMWLTDTDADTQVWYGTTTSYAASSTRSTTLDTDHSVTLSGLMPTTLYHYSVRSMNDDDEIATSSDRMFTTLALASTTTSTTTTSTTTDMTLQEQVNALKAKIAWLEQQIALIWQNLGQGTGGGTTTPDTMSAMIDQNGHTYTSGGHIDFGGHHFMPNQSITVSRGGVTVGSAYADGGGNFSTGSMTLPTTAGTYSYVFAGSRGDQATATITVQ